MNCVLVLVLLIATAATLHTQQTGANVPSIKKGDPPPGNSMGLSIPQARAALKEALKKRDVGTFAVCVGGNFSKVCRNLILTAATDIHIRSTGLDFTAPYVIETYTAPKANEKSDGKISVIFKKDQDYIQSYRLLQWPGSNLNAHWYWRQPYSVGHLSNFESTLVNWAWPVLEWSDETVAISFADAFNRLLYASQVEEPLAFSATAKAWRENPVKPPLNAEAERQRILAENAIQEKNLDAAIEHYESGVEAQPMWPAGWYNLALIYAEQNNYTDAIDCMKHYLELAPDAPDSKDARTQMIIWEDKAAKQ
jgi:tetratricopeptide (TPR) repeat protein